MRPKRSCRRNCFRRPRPERNCGSNCVRPVYELQTEWQARFAPIMEQIRMAVNRIQPYSGEASEISDESKSEDEPDEGNEEESNGKE